MNRIILIGNGFDLAHDLKTSYKDFINDYWGDIFKCLHDSPEGCYIQNDVKIQLTDKSTFFHSIDSLDKFIKSIIDHNTPNSCDNTLYVSCSVKNRFLIHITRCHLEKWVDVEYEYFRYMQKALKGQILLLEPDICKHITVLNDELARIETLLVSYLDNKIGKPEYCSDINKHILSPINTREISTYYKKTFIAEVVESMKLIAKPLEYSVSSKLLMDRMRHEVEEYLARYHAVNSDSEEYIRSFLNEYIDCLEDINHTGGDEEYVKDLWGKESDFHEMFRIPQSTMLVNFNYTDTPEMYIPKNLDNFDIVYIHGHLNDPDNIIFGYGDELCTEYKEFENSVEGEFLKNVKSIRYLETDNYRKLLEFADADKFQIFLMGHSCGLSDRTLLNTLFKHDNCVSIKPFYYIKDDGTDDYNDIVRNISRNFTDKPMMRDRVVNKTYCTTLSSSKK